MAVALTGPAGALKTAEREYASERRRTALSMYGGRVALGLGTLLLWQLLSGAVLDPFFFSRPSDMWAALVEIIRSGQFQLNVGLTVEEAFLGYIAGAFAAILAATVLGLFPRAYAIAEPFVLVIYSVPSVAVGPLLIVWFGIGLTPKIVLAGYFVFFVVFMNGITGIRSVPRGWVEVTRVMGASRLQLISKVILRAAAPHLMIGLRTALPQAVIGAVVAEFISSERGIGFLISNASAHYSTAGVFVAILILSVLVLAMSVLLNAGSALQFARRG